MARVPKLLIKVRSFSLLCPYCGVEVASGNEADWPQQRTAWCPECRLGARVPQERIGKLFETGARVTR